MENLNLPPFYIGQKVIYIGSVLPKNSVQTVKNLLKHKCGCWSVDVGANYNYISLGCECVSHGTKTKHKSSTMWFRSCRFVPLEERFISMSEVIKKEMPLVGAN